MGLDTSHDCFGAPYSAFMRWRIRLHGALGGEPSREGLIAAWERGDYDDQSVPINVLMNHSDCDGLIAHADTGPLADALEALIPKLPAPEHGMEHDGAATRARQFIRGLRDAAAAGEDVEFY